MQVAEPRMEVAVVAVVEVGVAQLPARPPRGKIPVLAGSVQRAALEQAAARMARAHR
jgi:hypothetical protein